MSDSLITIHVSHDGSDENDGLTEQTAKRTLEAAVAALNEKPGDVRVTHGVVEHGDGKPIRLRSGQWILGTD